VGEGGVKDYFCINCFESENIRNFIKENGIKKQEKYECSFCDHETEIEEYDVEECIEEYVNDCIEKKVREEDFEEKEDKYYEKCHEESEKKYLKICQDQHTETTYIIEQKQFISKLEEVIFKLYSYDEENTYNDMCRNASQNYCDGDETPEQYANLVSINDLESIEGKPEYRFSDLEEVLNDIGIDVVDENFLDIFNNYNDCYLGENVWKNKHLYTDELQFIDWKKFSYHVKHTARYFDHKEFNVIQNLRKFDDFFKIMKIKSNKIIYRARKIYNEDEKKTIEKNPSSELGKAPIKIVKNNRFSPIGISYGYFAFDKETALLESRALKGDIFAIGRFQLNDSLKLIDFRKKSLSELINPFLNNFQINVYYASFTINQFIKDISKPIEEKDTLLEYVPTQVMSEYIWSLDYDGFIFDSSQKEDGENIVIFGDNPSYNDYEMVHVIDKNIQFKKI
jgi:hypothetical protein